MATKSRVEVEVDQGNDMKDDGPSLLDVEDEVNGEKGGMQESEDGDDDDKDDNVEMSKESSSSRSGSEDQNGENGINMQSTSTSHPRIKPNEVEVMKKEQITPFRTSKWTSFRNHYKQR